MKGHPATCKCPRCPASKRGGRHPALCQCGECVRRRANLYYQQIHYRMEQTRAAMQEGPEEEAPIFVRAYWRKQPNFKQSDPGLRAQLLKERWNETK
jgi:hypothetical protein